MAKIDLTKYGITDTTEIVYNPSYEELFAEETKEGLTGYEKGFETELGNHRCDGRHIEDSGSVSMVKTLHDKASVKDCCRSTPEDADPR